MHLHQTNIVVVGAGPVGLVTALFAREHGLGVVVVEEKPNAVTHSCALALHPATLDLLEPLGVNDALLAQARRLSTLVVHAGPERIASIPVAADSRHDFVATIGQDTLENALAAALGQRGVPVWWNHRCARFEDDAGLVIAQVDELEESSTGYAVARLDRIVRRNRFVSASHLIGADGHGSLARRRLDIDFPNVGPAEHFAVFEFKCRDSLRDEISIVLHEDGIGVLWPLPHGRARWSFAVDPAHNTDAWRAKNHDPVQLLAAGSFPVLEDSSFRELLQKRAPWFRADACDIYWRNLVRFERRLAGTFGRGRTWLVGDAAHLTGPVGVQSMNAGFAEARLLIDILARHAPHAEGRELLEHYNHAARRHWRHLLGLDGAVAAGKDCPGILRPYAEMLRACLPATGASLSALAAELHLHLDPVDFELLMISAES